MTAYAQSLIRYVMANSDKSRAQAITYLNTFCHPSWRTRDE
ncbi:hypothetical protein [Parashewanella curva]|nr:hypothetical protein [Parashewanella curva]